MDTNCAIEETFEQVRKKVTSGEWHFPTDKTLYPETIVSSLLIEGYGLLAEKYFNKPGLARNFVLAFEEVLLTTWPKDDESSYYPKFRFALLGDLYDWMKEERNDFPYAIKERFEKDILREKTEEIKEGLREKYDKYEGERHESYRGECRGGKNFAYTVGMMLSDREDFVHVENSNTLGEMIDSVSSALNEISNWPNAGTIAWEARRVIRRADAGSIIEMGNLISQIGKKYPGGKGMEHTHLVYADDLFFYGEGSGELEKILDRLRKIAASEI